MLLESITTLQENFSPLVLKDIPIPKPKRGEIQIRISHCGVCHTELDEIEGRTPPPVLPVIPGHQVLGEISKLGEGCKKMRMGDRVGVAWIYSSCGICAYCETGFENLCSSFCATGRDVNGGYAEFMCVPEDFAYKIPDTMTSEHAAPLLCAGAIGYRSLSLANIKDGDRLGLTGFGASAHLVLKLVNHSLPDTDVFVFARNPKERIFALSLGAVWVGDTTDTPPELLDSIIDTTPVWKPVVSAMRCLKPGGRLVINAIRKEAYDKAYLDQLSYTEHLWMEKEIKSVANVTRKDVQCFLEIAAEIPIIPEYQLFSLEDANVALMELKEGNIRGAKILRI